MTRKYNKIEGKLASDIIRWAIAGYSGNAIDKKLGLAPGTANHWLKRKGYR